MFTRAATSFRNARATAAFPHNSDRGDSGCHLQSYDEQRRAPKKLKAVKRESAGDLLLASLLSGLGGLFVKFQPVKKR